jgi:hypothetical protein
MLGVQPPDQESCPYCGRRGENVACDTDIVTTRTRDGFAEESTDPTEVVHDDEEGGYHGDTFDTHDVVAMIDETISVDESIADVTAADGATEGCRAL